MRPPPPPPPAADTYQRPPPSLPPQPPNHPWPYPSPQFQYQSQTHQRSSPPPPQWPPPHSAEHAPYPSHPPHYPPCQPPPYAAHPHYPPSHPPPPRRLAPPNLTLRIGEVAAGVNNRVGSTQVTHNNEEDWGAKAKAWVAAKAATENQHPSSQFAPAGRLENHLNHFRDQYSQSYDPQFHDVPTPEFNYQQYPGSVGPPNRMPLSQFQGSQYISSGKSSYATDMHDPFDATDGTLTGASLTPLNPLIHQQEVPSSYSSVAGKEEAADRYEKFNSSSSLPVGPLSLHHVQPLPPEGGRSGWMEEPHNFGSVSAESASDLSNQLLSFPPQFKHNLDSHAQPKYTHSSGVPVRGGEPSNYAWTPSMAQGPVYPPMPPPIPLGVQVDNPITMSSAPMFPAGSSFQPTVPMIGAAFGVGAGVTPPAEFSGDAYGYSERPKKASVPNWLREERIKNKAVFTSSAPEIPKEDSQSIDEDSIDKSYRKGHLLDSKSVDSLRSTESDDEHEDEVETSRTVAINQEIKRVLTEVLLKVTDELFDEIATKVLNEDDLSVDVGRDVDSSNHQIPTESVLTPNASAKVLIPMKNKESDHKDASEKSTSAPTGDVLGLGSYASDEDDDEIQSSGKLNSKEISLREQTSSSKPSEVHSVNENGGSPDSKEQQAVPAKLEMDGIGTKSILSANIELIDHKADGDSESSNDPIPSKTLSMITENELQHVPDFSNLNKSLVEKAVERSEDHNSDAGRLMNDHFGFQEPGNRYDRNERLESKKSLTKRDPKNSESSNEKLYKNGDEEHGGHSITERTYYHGNSKDKGKKKSRTDEKVNHTGSRKQISPSGRTEGTTETHRNKRTSGLKDNNSRRKDRTGDEKRERSRHKSESESGRHKRHRSSSRGRGNKDNSVVSRANASSDESSDDSRRKSHHSKRRKSPSPSTTRKRPPPITASTIRRAA